MPETNALKGRCGHERPPYGLVHHTAAHARRVLGEAEWARYRKIGIVRDPWRWAWSRYRWVIDQSKMARKNWPEASRKEISEGLRELRDRGFRWWLLESGLNQFALEMHEPEPWTPGPDLSQAHWLCDEAGEVIVDRVMALESLTDGGFLGIHRPLPHVNVRTTDDSWREHFDQDCIDHIGRVCRWEIERFGYSF